MAVHPHTTVMDAGGTGHVEWIIIRDTKANETRRVPADALFVFIGRPPGRIGSAGRSTATTKASFCVGWITSGVPEDWPLDRRPYPLETRVPGVFVAGDVRKGSVKRLTVAAGEGAAAIDLVHRYLEATFDRPTREDRAAAAAPMTAAASASGGPS